MSDSEELKKIKYEMQFDRWQRRIDALCAADWNCQLASDPGWRRFFERGLSPEHAYREYRHCVR